MRYREWDPLQLSSSIDSGARVVKQSVFFNLFRTYRYKVTWNPISYENFGIFYGTRPDQKMSIVESIAKNSEKFHQSVNISLFSFNDNNAKRWIELEQKHPSFFYHPFPRSLSFFLTELLNFKKAIEEKSKLNKVIEPTNKVLHLVLLDLSEDEVDELKQHSGAFLLFKQLLVDLYYQRIYIGFFAKNAQDFDKDFHKLLDFSAYLGTDNDSYCRDIHSGIEENEYSRRQILIGTGWDKVSQKLINLHPLDFTPNEAFIQAEEKFKEEDEAYMRFLQSLDDGLDEKVKNDFKKIW